jgi:hypothetical protein
MTGLDLETLTALDAAGALGRSERFDLRSRLDAASPGEQGRARGFYEAGIVLALALPTADPPSAAVRRRLMGRLKGDPHEEPGVRIVPASEGWQAGSTEAVRIKRLGAWLESGQVALLVELAPGAQLPSHSHGGSEQCLVLDGDVLVGGRRLGPGDLRHAEPGTVHPPLRSLQGCRLLFLVSSSDYVERWSS